MATKIYMPSYNKTSQSNDLRVFSNMFDNETNSPYLQKGRKKNPWNYTTIKINVGGIMERKLDEWVQDNGERAKGKMTLDLNTLS